MRKFTRGAMVLAAAAGLAGGTAAFAHHSFAAEFDRDKPVKLQGEVVKFEWVNPHSWIHIKTADGKVWRVEG
ncbi:MAG: DUF6152 family protein, partial [Croceibacterium sp.]